MMSPFWTIFSVMIFSCLAFVTSQPFDYPTARLSTKWTNCITANHSLTFRDNSTVRAILVRGTAGRPRYAAGFYCYGKCETYLFALFIVQVNSGGIIVMPADGFPQVVWSANRNNPVRINATLELTGAGDLILRDADGSLAWSTNTAGKSVVGLNLTETGNLVLFDAKNSVVWESFDHPTDALVPGQILKSGMNLTENGGKFSVSMKEEGLVAYVEGDPPRVYYENLFRSRNKKREASYARFENGSLTLYQNSKSPLNQVIRIPIPVATSAQYMKLGIDGHVRVFEWGSPWKVVADLFGPSN
ncbi:hypothetical protein ACS0TY_017545 [Phlomoides rotata]